MHRYLVHLAYQGTKFRGWQRQLNTNLSIQECIEKILTNILSQPITIMGCGRTDSGVHAQQYFFHFDYESSFDFDLVERMNYGLPQDIRIFEILPVASNFHSRYDAISRSYKYYLHEYAHPYLQKISTEYRLKDLNLNNIELCLQTLIGTHDFAHLCMTPARNNTTVCTFSNAFMTRNIDSNQLAFHFTANRFLKSQIRLLVARLLAVGESILTVEQFMESKTNHQIIKYKKLAPPQGLHLTKIEYPSISLSTKDFHLI